MGDFNGRCVTKCPFSDKNIPHVFQSYNGNRLRQFIDANELCVVNTMPCCKDIYTRILNNQRSTIDCDLGWPIVPYCLFISIEILCVPAFELVTKKLLERILVSIMTWFPFYFIFNFISFQISFQ
jgi:hypothetical protein